MCKKCQVSFSLVNPKGKCWIIPESSGNSQVMCRVFRLQNRFAALCRLTRFINSWKMTPNRSHVSTCAVHVPSKCDI
jgi:hypothetical protein